MIDAQGIHAGSPRVILSAGRARRKRLYTRNRSRKDRLSGHRCAAAEKTCKRAGMLVDEAKITDGPSVRDDVRAGPVASGFMSVDLLHAILGGVFALVWIMVWLLVSRVKRLGDDLTHDVIQPLKSESVTTDLWQTPHLAPIRPRRPVETRSRLEIH